MRLNRKNSPILVKNDIKNSIKDNVEFVENAIETFKKPTKKEKNIQKQGETFKNCRKTTFKQLESRPAYSLRDLELDLLGVSFNIDPKIKPSKLNISLLIIRNNIIIFSYALLTFITLLNPENLSISSQQLQFMLISIAVTAYLFSKYKNSNLKHKSKCNKHTLKSSEHEILNKLCSILLEKFKLNLDSIHLGLQPEIKLSTPHSKTKIYLGLPLIHSLTYQELSSIIIFSIAHHHITLNNKFLRYALHHQTHKSILSLLSNRNTLIKKINEYAYHSSITATNASTFKNAILILEKCRYGFETTLNQLKSKQIIPMNLITQISCASMSNDCNDHINKLCNKHCLDNLLSNTYHTHNTFKNHSSLHLNFKASYLLKNPNEIANQISTDILLNYEFDKIQLSKTHSSHNPFTTSTNQDIIQNYYNSTYRLNRSINPNIEEGTSGSLLMLKTNIIEINELLAKKKEHQHKLLSSWDEYKSPNIFKGTCSKLTSLDLELENYERLLSLKTGLCISIILQVGTHDEQNNIYTLLEARRKASQLNKAMDTIINCIHTATDSSGKFKAATLSEKTHALLQQCAKLPQINGKIQTHLPLFSQEVLKKSLEKNFIEFTITQAIKLVHHIDDYKWSLENELISTCEKVEGRIFN